MFTSRRPWLKGTISYARSESVLPRTPIKVEPWAHDPFTTPSPPTRPTNQTPQVAHIVVAPSLNAPSGRSDPQPPLASHIAARLASSSPPPQRKRKRDVGAGEGEETGEERPHAHKRRRKALFETLPEAQQQSDAWEGKQNEHEQPPVQPRRSSRIQERNKKAAVLPKVENPAQLASRKRAVKKQLWEPLKYI